jgi:hypothetical protein
VEQPEQSEEEHADMTIRTNHARTVRIKTKVKAGDDIISLNHNQVRIKTKVKAGGDIISLNHNQVRIRTKVQARCQSVGAAPLR